MIGSWFDKLSGNYYVLVKWALGSNSRNFEFVPSTKI